MTPDDAVFRKVYATCQNAMDTYDYLPEVQAQYPFIFVGESFTVEEANNDLIGNVTQSIHIYGKRTDKKTVNQAIAKLHDDLLNARSSFYYALRLMSWSANSMPDNSTGTPLTHTIIETNFHYNRKEDL